VDPGSGAVAGSEQPGSQQQRQEPLMDYVRIPRYVDGMPQMLMWELDEVIVFVFCMLVGIITRELTLMVVFGVVIVRMFSGWKNGQLDGVLAHMAYWYGLSPLNGVFKNGNMREYVQ
jgi:conjugal transfer pilus assembly protein TraL